MLAGLDFGTSNCAIGIIENSEGSDKNQLLPIDNSQAFMPSSLYALARELICENVALQMTDASQKDEFMALRKQQLTRAQRVRLLEDIPPSEQAVFIGQEAVEQYLTFPGEGYYIKSVKSFLGTSGLAKESVEFFKDIVTAMMLHIKHRAEIHTQGDIEQVVIGRPVNFQGLNAEKSNRQAIDILTTAAKRAGYKSVEFLFEPVAAGLDFESKLTSDKTVLVIDVGGGTSDCAMLKMGPSFVNSIDRSADVLGHTGERIGGNDFDIQLARRTLMPLFGMNAKLKNGLQTPIQNFVYAVNTNNVGEQVIFNSPETGHSINQLLLDTTEPELVKRFVKLRDQKLNHQLVRSAEQCKIELSNNPLSQVNLDYIEKDLNKSVTRDEYSTAIDRPLSKLLSLIEETIKQAGNKPECVYITGGGAKSQIIRQAIESMLVDIEIVDGDHFGSVAKGLTTWAQRIFA